MENNTPPGLPPRPKPKRLLLTVILLTINCLLAWWAFEKADYKTEVRFMVELSNGGSISAFYQDCWMGTRWSPEKVVTSEHVHPGRITEVVFEVPVHKMRDLRLDINHSDPGTVTFYGLEINGNETVGPANLSILRTNDLIVSEPRMGQLTVTAGNYDPYMVLRSNKIVTGKGTPHSDLVFWIFAFVCVLCFFPFYPAIYKSLKKYIDRISTLLNKNPRVVFAVCALLKVLTLVLACRQDWMLLPLLLAEVVFLTALFRVFKSKWNWITFILLIMCSLQIVNAFATGKLVETETLLNLEEAKLFSWTFKLKLYMFLIWTLILFVPDMLAVPIKSIKRQIKIAIPAAFVVLEIFAFPIHNLGKSFYRIIDLVMTPPPDISKGSKFRREKIIDSGISRELPSTRKNVILLFAEGTSFECISPELMPNTTALFKESISFTNYYNHTAATFRGIRGQMISGFPMMGGKQAIGPEYNNLSAAEIQRKLKDNPPTIPSLPTILNKHNYRTMFMSPHNNNDRLGITMQTVGFQEVRHATDHRADAVMLTDREIYDSIWKELENYGKTDRPFMITAYILGTHHGFDSPDLRYKDGNEPLLNKFHNQDHWLGEFLKKFRNSKYAENTIIVLTSDHAIYPIPEARKIFNINTGYFMGKIPLIIYHKDFAPRQIDADRRNSLALAPTLLDLLGIHDEPNYFLGNSLFCSSATEFERVAAQGKEIYLTGDDGVVERVEKISQNVNQKWMSELTEYYRIIQ